MLCIQIVTCANQVGVGIGTQLVARFLSTSSLKDGIRRTAWDIWRGRLSNLAESSTRLSTSLATRHSLVEMTTRFSQIQGRLDTQFSTQKIHTRRSRNYLIFDGHVPDNRRMVKIPKISAASIVPDIGF